jgi:hypothetical protein
MVKKEVGHANIEESALKTLGIVHFKLHNITLVSIEVHLVLRSYVVVTWIRDKR